MAARKNPNPKMMFTPEQLQQIKKYAGVGLTNRQIAALFDICEDTFCTTMKNQPELKSIIEKGRAQAIAGVSAQAYDRALSGKDTAMTIFWLKTRARWAEARPVEDAVEEDKNKFTFTLNYKE